MQVLASEGEKLSEEEMQCKFFFDLLVYMSVLIPNGQVPNNLNANVLCDDILGFDDVEGEHELVEEEE